MAATKIAQFFNQKFFEIPRYQRGYAWEKTNVQDLFNDVVEAVESCSTHYIGTIVLSKDEREDEKFYVVDGQQRITTITLIIGELIRSLNPGDASYYERVYLREEGRPRLLPLNRDQDFLVGLLNGHVGEPQNKSQRLLKEAAEEIRFRVAALPDKKEFLKSVAKLEVMEFVENSEGDAIRIFQTVNDRGKPLSNMEKAKSLLVYFSNRYLEKELDSSINDCFSDIFELYDDIKHQGEELGISLIRNREFSEDSLMRYHFVTFSDEDYDPTATFVLAWLKKTLTNLRTAGGPENDYKELREFIATYISSLKRFFAACRAVIYRAESQPDYFKLFVVLGLSATLYPLIIKLEELGILDNVLPDAQRSQCTFVDVVELIDVRVYKFRGTDPKKDIACFVSELTDRRGQPIKDEQEVWEWLRWFNNRWMPAEQFKLELWGSNLYGNRGLSHIFLTYCEHLDGKKYSIEQLRRHVRTTPTVEHVLAQTPKFAPRALGFKNTEDFAEHADCLGNLTLLEKSLNTVCSNRAAGEKGTHYGKSAFLMTRQLGAAVTEVAGFGKARLNQRREELGAFCLVTWWAD